MRFPQFTDQPNAYAELIRLALYWLIGMGYIHMTAEQQALTLSLVSGALAVVVWRSVVPTQTIQDAGHSVTEIKQKASEVQNAAVADRKGTGDGRQP